MNKYAEFIYNGKEATMEKLSGKGLKITAACTGESAAGLDQWALGDLKLLSDLAYEELAVMLNMVEKGAEWPEQMVDASRRSCQRTATTS